ncbi:MAG: hypothetical protein VW169_14880, partial [Rhodospirillaceae bacterium]
KVPNKQPKKGRLWLNDGSSVLAGVRVKAYLVPLFGTGYRLAFNIFAVLHIFGVIAVGGWIFHGQTPSFELSN